MNDDKEVTVTVTPQDMEFRARAKAAGLPDILISMYGTALRKLITDEREAIITVAQSVLDQEKRAIAHHSKRWHSAYDWHLNRHSGMDDMLAAIRARGKE